VFYNVQTNDANLFNRKKNAKFTQWGKHPISGPDVQV
jgi:hypothetical protein